MQFFSAKMTAIGIQNPKIIVTNDYQQFLAHFDWFLSIFQISDVKLERKMEFFGLKTYFKKIYLSYFYPPTLPMQKKFGQKDL